MTTTAPPEPGPPDGTGTEPEGPPPVPGDTGPGSAPHPGDETELADLLLAMDAALIAGLSPVDPTPAVEPVTDAGRDARLARARGAVEALHRRWPWPGGAGSDGRSALAAAGIKVGRYVIRELLGRGGHGIVFLAHDPSLDRLVALKVPRPETLGSAEHRRRFLREGKAVARLDHPGIVPVYDLGESGPVCYIASAYIDGSDLALWLRNRGSACGPALAAGLVRSAAEAVGHAHAQRVVHRDLKPGNILVERAPGGTPTPRVTDFGLAKLLEADDEATRTGALLGTPRYMAPELAAGRHREVGPPSDVYSLGLILEELLGGPSADPPAELAAVLRKCREPEPADRYPDARGLADDLGRFLRGEPVLARRPGPVRRLRASARRRPGVAAAALLLPVVALLAAAGFIEAGQSARRREEAGRREQARLLEESRLREENRLRRAESRRADDAHDTRQAFELLKAGRLDLARPILDRLRTGPGGFARGHLDRLAAGRTGALVGHDRDVYSLAFSPDGRLLATAGADRTARLWDPATRAEVRRFEGHTDEVNGVAFSPDGRLIATASDDRTARLWRVGDGAPVGPPLVHGAQVVTALFSPDGRTLVTCGREDRLVRTWDVADGRPVATLDAGVTGRNLEGLTPAGPPGRPAFAATGGDATVWRLGDDGRALTFERTIKLANEHMNACVAFSRDGRRAAGYRVGRGLALFDGGTGGLLRLAAESAEHNHPKQVLSVTFSPDGRVIATTSKDCSVRLWDAETLAPREVLLGHEGQVWATAFSPDGRVMASAGGDGEVLLWDATRPVGHVRVDGPPHVPVALAFTAGDASLVVVDDRGGVAVIDPSGKGAPSTRPALAAAPTESLTLSPDGRRFALRLDFDSAHLFDREGGRPGRRIDLPGHYRLGSLDPAGLLLVTDWDGPTARVVDTAAGRVRFERTDPDPDSWIFCGLLAGDALYLVRASDRGPIRVERWDIGRPGGPALRPEAWVESNYTKMSISPDHRLLATYGGDGITQVWDARTLVQVLKLPGHGLPVAHAAFSPDGGTLATAGRDLKVDLWDVATGRTLFTLEGHRRPPGLLAFSADGRTLASAAGSPDGGPSEVILWQAAGP